MCWSVGTEAATPLAPSPQPFLARAKAIEVVTVGTDLKSTEVSGADIANHFARHGLNVELKKIATTDVDVPNAILSHAADVSADLIVMGGYGHSAAARIFPGRRHTRHSRRDDSPNYHVSLNGWRFGQTSFGGFPTDARPSCQRIPGHPDLTAADLDTA